ncbi:MAG: hypothetical protein Q9162_002801 [Coniocarpon cinnabarinum]
MFDLRAACHRQLLGEEGPSATPDAMLRPYNLSEPTSLPQGLRDPPGYEEAQLASQEKERKRLEDMKQQRLQDADDDEQDESEQPPAYSETNESSNVNGARQAQSGSGGGVGEDTIHYLRPSDTMTSISLAYRVPLQVLRSHNNLYSDHLLSARHEIFIPASHYQGPSLSAEPVESEEERQQKARLRRFMIRTKCADYGIAEVYLRNAKDDVDTAVERWEDDERWERENPMRKTEPSGSGKKGFGAGLTGQLR